MASGQFQGPNAQPVGRLVARTSVGSGDVYAMVCAAQVDRVFVPLGGGGRARSVTRVPIGVESGLIRVVSDGEMFSRMALTGCHCR